MSLGDIIKKFEAFGFSCMEVDGHDISAITKALKDAGNRQNQNSFCCNTVKGKGVSFMENQYGWHGRPIECRRICHCNERTGGSLNGKVTESCIWRIPCKIRAQNEKVVVLDADLAHATQTCMFKRSILTVSLIWNCRRELDVYGSKVLQVPDTYPLQVRLLCLGQGEPMSRYAIRSVIPMQM